MAAAGKWKVYEQAKLRMGGLTAVDFTSASNWSLALFLSTSNANTLSGSSVYADLTNEVANGLGYLTGGVAITGESFTNTTGTETFTSGTAVWTASGGSIVARFGVIYKNATVNAIVKPILCVCLLDATPADVTATTGNTLTITMNASGIFTLSGAAVD